MRLGTRCLPGTARTARPAFVRDASMTAGWYSRPVARQWRCEPPSGDPRRFHASLPGYRPTELAEVPALADELNVGRVFVKDESGRLSLGAFKVLGASWAVTRMLAQAAGRDPRARRRRAARDHGAGSGRTGDGDR